MNNKEYDSLNSIIDELILILCVNFRSEAKTKTNNLIIC